MVTKRHSFQTPNPYPSSIANGDNILKNNLFFSLIVLVHNHPSGDPTPSRADIEMTKQIIDSAKPLGIAVHDHIIIGKKGNASMKGLLLI